MNRALLGSLLGVLSVISLSPVAWARGSSGGSMREEYFMVGNGQGISSPSFWSGLSGANPAGMVNNQRLKVQGAAATFDDSTKNARGSIGALIGNGVLGAGLEYSGYNASPYPTGNGQINWATAGRFDSIHTSIGISGHHMTNSSSAGSYDIGTLIELLPSVRLGGLLPDVSRGFHVVGGGLTFELDSMVDFVVDAAYHVQDKNGMVKPGLTLRTDRVMATAAYGVRFTGTEDVLLYSKFTAGLGIKFTDNVLIEYEYRGLPEHRLGLTLRLN